MLTIEPQGRTAARVPGLAKLGLAVMAVAGLADVVAHLEVSDVVEAVGHAHEHTGFEASAHLGVFVGMVLVLLGVVVDGFQRSRARRGPVTHEKGDA